MQSLLTQFQAFAKDVDIALQPRNAEFDAFAKAVGASVEQQKAKYAPMLESFAKLSKTEEFQRWVKNLRNFSDANKSAPIYVPPLR